MAKPQKNVDLYRPKRPYARKGPVYHALSGELICTLADDVYAGDPAMVDQVKLPDGSAPAPGDLVSDGPLAEFFLGTIPWTQAEPISPAKHSKPAKR